MRIHAVAALLAMGASVSANATTPLSWSFGTSAPGAVNVSSVSNSRHGVTLSATARLLTAAPNALTNLAQTRAGAMIQQSRPGIGVAGGGSPSQLDTNDPRRREAILVSASRALSLSGLRLSSVDSNDTLQIYGVAADGTLTSLGLDGVIRSGLRGVRAPLNNLAGAATGSFV